MTTNPTKTKAETEPIAAALIEAVAENPDLLLVEKEMRGHTEVVSWEVLR